MGRKLPNIIITGTPGVGKSSHAEQLAEKTSLQNLSINDFAADHNCITGRDSELQTAIVDEDLLLDALETTPLKETGGYIIDWHACDLFPESWIDLVVVLRADTEVLYDRLISRGYGSKKVEENMDAEIMQVVLEEAREGFEEEIVVELTSNGIEELEANVDRLVGWVDQWKKDHVEDEEDDNVSKG
jgi:adenylate kinase